jgi:hypothetical protein
MVFGESEGSFVILSVIKCGRFELLCIDQMQKLSPCPIVVCPRQLLKVPRSCSCDRRKWSQKRPSTGVQ